MAKHFFNEAMEQSAVKATIVSKYFLQWFRVIKNTVKGRDKKVGYIDLFAGPGRYSDGTKSTPLLVLETAIGDADLRDMLVTVFNDADPEHTDSLSREIKNLDGIDTLKYEPQIMNEEISDTTVDDLEGVNFIPTLFFVDPFGYKGLSLRLINTLVKGWACECVFFFNYNRINMGLPNASVEKHLDALFGPQRADTLREELKQMRPHEREFAIVEGICEALEEMGGKYILPFRFKRKDGRTSHHLIFVSKHPHGYKIMKAVMATQSSGEEQGVPTLEYNPTFGSQGFLFDLARPLDDLADMLLEEYAGKTMTMDEIYEDHNYGYNFVERNYKTVLNQMEAAGQIECDPPCDLRPKRKGEPTFAGHVKVTFPKKAKKNGTVKHRMD